MERRTFCLLDCSTDSLFLILEHLADNAEALCSLSLTCKALRNLSLPYLLKSIDLSSHNNGRQPEYEDEIRPEIYADFSDEYRPTNLVSRQRAFLRLMIDRPELATHVQSLTWTLIWMDFDEESLQKIDFELWNVFGRLTTVQYLDLASLHQIAEEQFIRKNPPRLFPAVTHLRLLGWMHRGLVDAVLNSMNPSLLHSLKIDFLQDEGAFPNGKPMSMDSTKMYTARFTSNRVGYDYNYTETISEELYQRQQTGIASAFPGPMWTPLHILSKFSSLSLKEFELRIPPYDTDVDLRNYFKCFDEATRFLSAVAHSLGSLTIVFAECPSIYDRGRIGTARNFSSIVRPKHMLLAAYFLTRVLPVLNDVHFPFLDSVTFQGFSLLQEAELDEGQSSMSHDIRKLGQNCVLVPWQSATRESRVDRRPVFRGYDYYPDKETMENFQKSLEQS